MVCEDQICVLQDHSLDGSLCNAESSPHTLQRIDRHVSDSRRSFIHTSTVPLRKIQRAFPNLLAKDHARTEHCMAGRGDKSRRKKRHASTGRRPLCAKSLLLNRLLGGILFLGRIQLLLDLCNVGPSVCKRGVVGMKRFIEPWLIRVLV